MYPSNLPWLFVRGGRILRMCCMGQSTDTNFAWCFLIGELAQVFRHFVVHLHCSHSCCSWKRVTRPPTMQRWRHARSSILFAQRGYGVTWLVFDSDAHDGEYRSREKNPVPTPHCPSVRRVAYFGLFSGGISILCRQHGEYRSNGQTHGRGYRRAP